ncbi:MAG: hypothetical protein JNL39_14440 [Opitutaceae bacterium]|nr:hypothetical protein [Opitutaceae bacterium]
MDALIATARFALLLAGLTVPGALLARALHVPVGAATSLAGSAVALGVTVVALQLCGGPISLATMAAGLGIICLAARLVSGGPDRKCEPASEMSRLSRGGLREQLGFFGWWTPLYALFWIAVLLRVWHAPLNGPDIEFRWGWLAEQMLARGSLDFYPPRTTGDFFDYFWAESIPPGVAALHAWAFACAGGAKAAWTIPAALLQIVALHEVLWRTAQHFGGDRAARFACLAAAACPLLTWAVLLGQETGLTTLALAGLGWALISWRQNLAGRWAALAGVFALLGAGAREYGLVFPALAAGGFLALRADRKTWIEFTAIAALALVWPLRTWLLTGNPFHSIAVGGLFPVNDRFAAWVGAEAEAFGAALRRGAGWAEAGRYLVQLAPAALFGWIWLVVTAVRRGRTAWWGLASVLAFLALWALSVRYTNGGLFYSLRVAAPALALGAVAAGEAMTTTAWAQRRVALLAPALLGFLVLAALPPTLALPRSHTRTPWREWPAFATTATTPVGIDDEIVAIVMKARATLPAREPVIVLADSPGFQRRFAPTGIDVLPLWSPHVNWLFDRGLSPEATRKAWRDSGLRFIVVAKWQPNLEFFNRHSRWQEPPLRADFVGETKLAAVFALRAMD